MDDFTNMDTMIRLQNVSPALLALQQTVLAEMAEGLASRQQWAVVEGVLGILDAIAEQVPGCEAGDDLGDAVPCVGRVRRCGRCGWWVAYEGQGTWVDATEGDCCEAGVHFPVEDVAVPWTVALEAGGERIAVGCFAASAVEAGQVAVRIQGEIDAEINPGVQGGARSYDVVSVERA